MRNPEQWFVRMPGFADSWGDLSVDEINEAMRRHIDLSRITVVKAGDFAGVSEDPELVP